MLVMAIDFEKEFFDNINRNFDAMRKTLKEHNERHEADLKVIKNDLGVNTKATTDLATHVAKQNGRIGKLEKKRGRHINLDNKTLTIFMIVAVVFMVLVVAGKEGLNALQGLFKV